MDKAESKFANMAKRMDSALIELLEEKPFSAITVTDVCKAAGAHRSTFYSHYDNTLDLLNEVKDATMREFFASFEHLPRETALKDRKYLEVYLRFVEEHKRLFRVFLENINLFDGFGILESLEGNMQDIVPARSSREKRVSKYKLLFTAAGTTSIVSMWLESGCKESRSELADIILACANVA
ncbi:TetR/AcrR family transcriptional regulator [Anaerotardibacter muris]|uniref:TetR/AcrR family transcriptional regulator n=1 Tax=Anaerotardibacter muris TaxID=2941505 RepID=UPI00203EA77D|nr:TetR/AcrR family transcriptional regulator [Anaerotardibacter muris]